VLPVFGVLNSEEIEQVQKLLQATRFEDGKATAGPKARDIKNNLQADPKDENTKTLQTLVREALLRNPDFRLYARPARWARLMFSRYGPRQHYGRHFDNWSMTAHDGGLMRSDMSFTLFLANPDSYDGGELALEKPEGRVNVKLPAGAAFIYPTNVLHQVLPVQSGERLVCVGWIQSQIRNDEQRTILYDLEKVLANIPKGEPHLLLDKSIGTMLRMWADC
jgi:PKHD-type hydroxylase